jgi:hypothetical protein
MSFLGQLNNYQLLRIKYSLATGYERQMFSHCAAVFLTVALLIIYELDVILVSPFIVIARKTNAGANIDPTLPDINNFDPLLYTGVRTPTQKGERTSRTQQKSLIQLKKAEFVWCIGLRKRDYSPSRLNTSSSSHKK